METRITELFGIKYPIILSGMSWISVPKMVAAVSNAGGLGILATGPLSKRQTREAIKEIRDLTDKPFGANTTLFFPGSEENAKILLEEQVPVINFALGKGDWIVKEAHAYGGKVISTVTNARHAGRAQDFGVDAVIATGREAAAHASNISILMLVPYLFNTLKIPIIAAGGIANGRGLAAALLLGAEGIAMGTRFMNTRESPLHEVYKKLSREKNGTDTIFSDRFDGLYCRILDTQAARRAIKRGLNLSAAFLNSRQIARDMELPYGKLLSAVIAIGWKKAYRLAFMASAFKSIKIATEDGDMKNGVLPIGQGIDLIHDEPTVAELLARIVNEANDQLRKVNDQVV